MPQPIEITTPLVIWRIIDGKPGHENQTLGLANAMRRLAEQSQRECVVCDIPANRKQAGPISFLRRHFPAGEGLPAPDFILAAGSGTHWSLLCAQRRYGGKSVVLMKPSLPLSWFDWVVVPEHDGVSGKNVIVTKGVLNPMQPGDKVPGSVLVLVGGESKHFEWDNEHVRQALLAVFKDCADASYIRVTDSRRTPVELKAWLGKNAANYFPAEQTPSGWLAEQLSSTERVYVTTDSVSMVYESLTAGCDTQAIWPGTTNKKSRVAAVMQQLARDGWLASAQVAGSGAVKSLNEANRIAEILCR